MRKSFARKNCIKRICFVFFIAFFVLMCSGCSLTPKYYPKRKVKKFTKDLVADDVKYIKKEKIEGRKVFYFKDSEGRPFSVIVNSKKIRFIYSELPLYTTEIADTYQYSIFQYERDRIQKILDDSGLNWSKLSSFDEEIDKIEQAEEGYCLYRGLDLDSPIKKEDLKVIARTGAEIDQILRYDYDRDIKTKLNFKKEQYYLSDICIVFCDDETGLRQIDVPFSTSEDNRWTEESLYDYLLKQYTLYEKEGELRDELPKSATAYLEKKYKKEFIDVEIYGIPLNKEMEVMAYEKGDTEKELITVTVSLTPKGDGEIEFEYTDNYDIIEYSRKVNKQGKGQ